MPNKALKLFIIFVVFFSRPGFSQTPENSEHPLLDKYYPQKKSPDTNKTITSQINPVPVATRPLSETKVLPVTKPVPEATQTLPPPETNLASETKAVPGVTATKPITTVTDTTAINKPAVTPVAAAVPVPAKAPGRPPKAPYNENRLGSSTPAYDTWEKNNNGAGSVTTSPK